MIELLTIPDFLDAPTRADFLSQMREARGGPATVYGRKGAGAVETMVRKVTRIPVAKEITERVTQLMMERKREVEEYFSEKLSEGEEPQFLR